MSITAILSAYYSDNNERDVGILLVVEAIA